MAYTTQAKVEQMFGISIPASAVSAVAKLIEAAKLFIDRYCGKTFEGASETRYYDGNGENEILIDAFTSLSSVKILNSDGTEYDSLTEGQANDYVTLPYNSSEKNVIRLTGNGYWGKFSKRSRLLEVTGVFGGSVTCPADIEVAATKIVGQAYNDLGGEGNLSSVRLGDYQAAFAAMDEKKDALGIFAILDQHRDINI